jgi:hypothetical protein
VAEIRPQDIEEAFRRWRDFIALQPVNEKAMNERKALFETGELTMRDLMNKAHAETDPRAAAERVAAIRESVGLNLETQTAFWLELDKEFDGHPLRPILTDEFSREQILTAIRNAADERVSTGAFIGLIVGLTARQLAEERPEIELLD